MSDLQRRQQAERRLSWAWKRHQLARNCYDGSDFSRARLRAALIELEAAELEATATLAKLTGRT